MAGVEVWMMALAVLIVFAGASIQAAIGVGLGLMAAPTLSLMDDSFIPGAIVIVNLPLTIGIAWRERDHIDWGILRAVPMRGIGTVAGAWLVASGGRQATSVVVAVAVLFAVVATLTRLTVAPTPRNQSIAGAASGLAGTVAGIGGPPMAITYQHSDPRVLRSTLAAFNFISLAVLSIPSLALAGVIGGREIRLAAVLIPAVFAGLWVGKHAIVRMAPERVRYGVLATCAASAVVLLARQLT
jgi:uncharacterized membrane protein YfcA